MKRSLGEIEAIMLKAARGVGMPLGHAEDFAISVRRLAATQPEALPEVMDALTLPHDPVVIKTDQPVQDARVAMAGPIALDVLRCGASRVTLQNVDAPAVMHAMVAALAADMPIAVLHDGRDVTLTSGAEVSHIKPPAHPVWVDPEIWSMWDTLAAKTYVPATEASRLSGAGAGLTDND